MVLLTHLAYPRFSGGRLEPLRSFGNDAVMVFFVLSGYVIAHTAARAIATCRPSPCIVSRGCGPWRCPPLR